MTSISGMYTDLDAAYDRLRIANQRLRDEWSEYCRLKTLGFMLGPHRQENTPSQFNRYRREGFGNQIPSESEWWSVHHDRLTRLSDGERRLIWWKFDEEVRFLEGSREDFEVMRCNVRNRINKLSRPYLRDLTILDLPNELLLEVFKYVEPPTIPDFPFRDWCSWIGKPRTSNMQNARLVCRQFCGLVSPRLIRIVSVGPNDWSLARLEEISHHPTLAEGVRVVRILPHFYNSAFADFNQSILHHATILREELGPDKVLWRYQDERYAEAQVIVTTLEKYTSNYHVGGDGQHEKEDGTRLKEVHEEYLARLKSQELLMASGKFERVVSSAMARMPGARNLQFGALYDWSTRAILGWPPGDDPWNDLYHFMLRPKSGSYARRRGLELPSYQCFARLMIALRDTGVFLSGISIALHTIGGPGSLVLAPDIRKQLSLSMQQLKIFDFILDRQGHLDHPEAGDLNDFLSACLDTDSLQSIILSTNGNNDGVGAIDLGKVMGSRNRAKLTRISLYGPSIDLSNLIVFLDALPESMTCLHMNELRLRNGSWKRALDELRKKKYYIKEDILIHPKGAECSYMSDREVNRIFAPCRGIYGGSIFSGGILGNGTSAYDVGPLGRTEATKAERYILGRDPHNPL